MRQRRSAQRGAIVIEEPSAESPRQGGPGGPLAGGDRWRWRALGGVAEAFDLGADVALGVEAGPGDSGGAGDGLEGDRGSGVVEFAQRADGLGAGQLMTPAGGSD